MPRCRTWNFSHTLYTSILPEATRGLHPTSTIDPFALIKSLFEKLFKEGPAPVFYIHLRVSRAAFDLCVLRENWCRFARSSVCGLHSGQISRWPINFATMVGRKMDSGWV